MTDRITAVEARKLAGPSVDERVDDACERIRNSAESKRRFTNLDNKFWGSVPGTSTDDYKAACNALRALGFTVRFVPVDPATGYTIVEW